MKNKVCETLSDLGYVCHYYYILLFYIYYVYMYIIKYQSQIEVLGNTPVNSTHLASEATFGLKHIFGTLKNEQNHIMMTLE